MEITKACQFHIVRCQRTRIPKITLAVLPGDIKGLISEVSDTNNNLMDFPQVLAKRFSLDCFSFIRLINYIRLEKPSACLVMSLASTDLWSDDKYMKPVSCNLKPCRDS